MHIVDLLGLVACFAAWSVSYPEALNAGPDTPMEAPGESTEIEPPQVEDTASRIAEQA